MLRAVRAAGRRAIGPAARAQHGVRGELGGLARSSVARVASWWWLRRHASDGWVRSGRFSPADAARSQLRTHGRTRPCTSASAAARPGVLAATAPPPLVSGERVREATAVAAAWSLAPAVANGGARETIEHVRPWSTAAN